MKRSPGQKSRYQLRGWAPSQWRLVLACAALWFRDGLTDAYPRLERWLYDLLGLHMEFFAGLMHLTWDAVEETVRLAHSPPA